MKIALGKHGKGTWHKFLDGELEIVPYPASMSSVVGNTDGYVRIEGKDQLKAFMHCLKGWKGFVDDDGNDIKLTDKVKRDVYDYASALGLIDNDILISVFVLKKAGVLAEGESEEKENS